MIAAQSLAQARHCRSGGDQAWRPLRIAAIAGALLVAACGPAPAPPAASMPADGWYDFGGSWNAAGRRHTIGMGGDRQASLLDLSGSLLLSGAGRPGVGFGAEAIVLADTQTGMVGRAIWTDQNGDHVYSEVRGDGTGKGNRVTGTIVGGTGLYAGASGTYTFRWQYVLEAEDGTVQGRTLDLAGRVRLGTAGTRTDTPAAKP